MADLLSKISAQELVEWQMYYQLEPFGEDNRNAGLIAASVYNANRGKGQKVLSADDCKLRVEKPQSSEDHLRIVQALHAAFGGGHGHIG